MPEGTEEVANEAGPKLARQKFVTNIPMKIKVAPFFFTNH